LASSLLSALSSFFSPSVPKMPGGDDGATKLLLLDSLLQEKGT